MAMKLPITINGVVLHGNHLGSTINIPTANVELPKDFENIEYGVYYSQVTVDGKTYRAMSNVGRKPTIKDDNLPNVESFIYDFEGDLYEKEICVQLLEFRRPEKKFKSFAELSRAMTEDLEAGKNYQNQ